MVIVASKNVPHQARCCRLFGREGRPYKDGRVAAMGLSESGTHAHALRPNAVYDTAIWTDDVLFGRVKHCGLRVEEYKISNLLRAEVISIDVAKAVAIFAGESLAKTIEAQLPVTSHRSPVTGFNKCVYNFSTI